MNILIPCAGLGNRFIQSGYTFPKPLIPVQNMNGDPMIKIVIDNLNIDGNYIFVCRKEHEEHFNIKSVFEQIKPNSKILTVDYLTDGSACTCLLAKKYINTEDPLIIADCDHFPIWDSNLFLESMKCSNSDGVTVIFKSYHPKFSYVKTNSNGFVMEIKEKVVISDKANVGIYYWKKGSDFVKYTKQMILKNIRVNNEFYTAPVYNEAIQDEKKITTYFINKNWELGTPEDLDYFIENYEAV